MGAEAQIIGFGPFKKEYLECDLLPYPDDYYEDVKEGTIVIVEFCRCNTSEQSRLLAEACGAQLGDFNTHFLGRGEGILMHELDWMIENAGIAEWGEDDVYSLDRLVKTGEFRFFLQPHM